jgi:hypothetical protein
MPERLPCGSDRSIHTEKKEKEKKERKERRRKRERGVLKNIK